jgi:hypothetical protein
METQNLRIAALEDQMGDVKEMLTALVDKMHTQSLAIADLSKQYGKNTPNTTPEVSTEASSQGESRLAGKKVKLPLFEGEDPVAWITRAEIYFDVQNTTADMKVKLARLSMEGPTIHWFNLLMETEDDLSWEKLKRSLIARYGGRRLENPFEELSTLTQKGSVEEFVESFELLSSQVGRLPEEQYLGYFMSGLKPQIRRKVRTLNPKNRMEVMRIAKDVEDELREEDDDGKKYYGKKGVYDRVGRKDWAGSPSHNQNGSSPKEITRASHSGWSKPNSSSGSVGSNSKPTSSLFSSARRTKGQAHRRSGKGFALYTVTKWLNGELKDSVLNAAASIIRHNTNAQMLRCVCWCWEMEKPLMRTARLRGWKREMKRRMMSQKLSAIPWVCWEPWESIEL